MRRRLLITIAAVATACLAAGAVPALTADNGSVTVTITAQPAAAPCITVAPTSLDFGTLAFSAPSSISRKFIGGAGTSPTVTNCGTAGQWMTITGSDASGSTGSWTPSGAPADTNPCPDLDTFNLTAYREADTTQDHRLTSSTVLVRAVGGVGPYVQAAGGSDNFGFTLDMPCQGSNGAGEQKTLTVTFTAALN
jgi:hypothetical protein